LLAVAADIAADISAVVLDLVVGKSTFLADDQRMSVCPEEKSVDSYTTSANGEFRNSYSLDLGLQVRWKDLVSYRL
jgi:hypothetical protein